jgi:hypothetical protein
VERTKPGNEIGQIKEKKEGRREEIRQKKIRREIKEKKRK